MLSDNLNTGSPIIQKLNDDLFEDTGISVQVLRLDLLHPVISGNKWLKLQPWLKIVKQQQLRGILTKGGPYSNYIHAAAYAAFKVNLDCTVIVKAKEGTITPTISDLKKWNADIVYAPAGYLDDEKWEALARARQQLFIPMGGDGPIAVNGVSEYFKTINLPSFDHVICPVGTGTTLKGIAAACLFKKTLTGINPGINDDYEAIRHEFLQQNKRVNIKAYPALKKFGKWPSFLPYLMNGWFDKWQLPTDVVYTAKMMNAFFNQVQENYFEKGDDCLLIHTGGLQGNRSLPEGMLNF